MLKYSVELPSQMLLERRFEIRVCASLRPHSIEIIFLYICTLDLQRDFVPYYRNTVQLYNFQNLGLFIQMLGLQTDVFPNAGWKWGPGGQGVHQFFSSYQQHKNKMSTSSDDASKDYQEFLKSSSEEEDNDEEEYKILLATYLVIVEESKKERKFKMNEERVDWDHHVDLLLHRNEFVENYGYSVEAFHDLVDLLRDDITYNEVRAMNSAPDVQPIYPELVCAVGLRVLKGAKRNDVTNWAGISRSSFFRCRDIFLMRC